MLCVKRRILPEKVEHHIVFMCYHDSATDPRIAQWFDKLVKQLAQHNANRYYCNNC